MLALSFAMAFGCEASQEVPVDAVASADQGAGDAAPEQTLYLRGVESLSVEPSEAQAPGRVRVPAGVTLELTVVSRDVGGGSEDPEAEIPVSSSEFHHIETEWDEASSSMTVYVYETLVPCPEPCEGIGQIVQYDNHVVTIGPFAVGTVTIQNSRGTLDPVLFLEVVEEE